MQNLKIYKQALEHFGTTSQIIILFEEMGELITATSKYLRYPNVDTFTGIIDELADVEIMLSQMKTLLDVWEDVEKQRNFKLKRLESRILAKDGGVGPIIINPDKSLEAIRNYCIKNNISESDALEIFNLLQKV